MRVAAVASGLGFAEGPTLLQSGGLAVVSIDQQRLYAVAADAPPVVLAALDAAPNGCTEGPHSMLFLAAFSGAWPADPACDGAPGVFAWHNGEVTVVSAEPAAPNDLCFGPDGHLYVTDPVRGEAAGRLWCIDAETGAAQVLVVLDWYPNGIGFDADDNLWVADTVGRRLVRFDGTAVTQPGVAFALPHGKPDGFAFDTAGSILVAAPPTPEHTSGSVVVLDADGTLTEVLVDDEGTHPTNVAITSDGTAYVTEARGGQVLSLDGICAPGLPLHPFR